MNSVRHERSSLTLVTGARGGIGASLVRRLHAAGHDVRAASRAPEKLELPAGVPAVALDLADPATVTPALAGVTDLFLYAEPAGVEELLGAVSVAGLRRLVLLSSDSVTVPDAEHSPLARQHLLVERAVRAAPVIATVLRPGAFAGNALGWADPIRGGRPVEEAYPDARIDPIHSEDIVDVAELALTTDALDGRVIRLCGPEPMTFRDQARTLGEVLGREVELREVPRARAAEQLARFMPAPFAEALLDYWAQVSDGPTGPRTAEHPAERITGRPGRPFRQWALEHLDAFR